MRCAYQHVVHRGVEGEHPCRNGAKAGHRYCHRHLLEERQEIERMYPAVWIAAQYIPYEGYSEPEAVFLTEEEGDQWLEKLSKREQGYYDLIKLTWRGETDVPDTK
ncbi:hypothetical protein HOT31_gp108 [Microbacterium phage Hendrix]|uniref:Uncharacterized protein n=1 Tax=Microbacterium phage Hendrix TaxID=2182341 RepID=A0A2U8UUI2_9CAUD|nr:hypothetical protein HOT31_gp108 [Microbacterium phage Hendrix]AWN07779.1 hypothetical protein PBI_HENDRIX_108 [Microbacterium phage Hendrix]